MPSGAVTSPRETVATQTALRDGALSGTIRPPSTPMDGPVLPRRIGLDACCFVGSRTGIANYVEALLGPLCEQQPDVTFVLYSNEDGDFPSKPNIERRMSRPKRRGPLWHNTQLPGMLREDAIDVFWGTNGLIPLCGLEQTATIVTIHDLAHRFVPHTQRAAVRWKQRVFQPLCARAADRLVAVSKATADDVAMHYGRAPDAVIQPVASSAFGPVNSTDADAALRRLGLSTPYLLTVGTLEPRKNILALIQAYAACVVAGATLPPLIVVGGRGWLDKQLLEVLANPALGDRIRWLRAHGIAGAPLRRMPGLPHAVAVRGFRNAVARGAAMRCPRSLRRYAGNGRGRGARGRADEPEPCRSASGAVGSGGGPIAPGLPPARHDPQRS